MFFFYIFNARCVTDFYAIWTFQRSQMLLLIYFYVLFLARNNQTKQIVRKKKVEAARKWEEKLSCASEKKWKKERRRFIFSWCRFGHFNTRIYSVRYLHRQSMLNERGSDSAPLPRREFRSSWICNSWLQYTYIFLFLYPSKETEEMCRTISWNWIFANLSNRVELKKKAQRENQRYCFCLPS